MKKLLILFTAFSLMAGVHAQEAYSNTIGMVKITVPPSGLYLAGLNFISGGQDEINLTDMIGTSGIPTGTTIWKWDRSLNGGMGGYVGPIKYAPTILTGGVSVWNPSSVTVVAGDAFFIINPSDTEMTVVLSGNVPEGDIPDGGSQKEVSLANAHGFLSYPIPVPTQWQSTALAESAPENANLWIWNPTGGAGGTGSYELAAQKKSTILSPTPVWNADPVIQPGQAFWLSLSVTPPSVSETVPYTLD